MATHASNSQFGDYTRCGKSFQLKRIQHVPPIPSVWLVGGKAVHMAIESINRQLYKEGQQ